MAGECLPFNVPFGCLTHVEEVKDEMLEELVPQYLHVYFDFSLPS
jgi:hypothetical protein